MKTVGYGEMTFYVQLEKEGTFEEYQEFFHDTNDFDEIEILMKKNGVLHKVKVLTHSFDLDLAETEQINEEATK